MMNLREEKVGTAAENVDRFDKIGKVRNIAEKSICKIQTFCKVQGTGTLYRVIDKQKRNRFLLMTCSHVLPTNSIYNIKQSQFFFPDVPKMANITFDNTVCLEHIKFVWNDDRLDATVIELSSELAAQFKYQGANFFKVGKATLNVDVVILQFPLGEYKIADGDIEKIEGDHVLYQIGTEARSSGSPLLNFDCVALAMHNAGLGVASSNPAAIRQATVLSAVVEAYLDKRPDAEPDAATATKRPAPMQPLYSGAHAIKEFI